NSGLITGTVDMFQCLRRNSFRTLMVSIVIAILSQLLVSAPVVSAHADEPARAGGIPTKRATVYLTSWLASDSRTFSAHELIESHQAELIYDWDWMALKLRNYLRAGMVCESKVPAQQEVISLVVRVEMKDGSVEEYFGSGTRLVSEKDSCHRSIDESFKSAMS